MLNGSRRRARSQPGRSDGLPAQWGRVTIRAARRRAGDLLSADDPRHRGAAGLTVVDGDRSMRKGLVMANLEGDCEKKCGYRGVHYPIFAMALLTWWLLCWQRGCCVAIMATAGTDE